MILIATGLAGPLPPNVDTEDLGRWERLSAAALDGPAGCWVFTGDLRIRASFESRVTGFRRGESTEVDRRGTFAGQLEDGEWTRFDYHLTREDGVSVEVPVQPAFGRMKPGVSRNLDAPPPEPESDARSVDDDLNLMRQVMSGWNTRTGVSYAHWRSDLDAVELVEAIPSTDDPDSKPISKSSIFPLGGDVPTRVSLTFPHHLAFGTWPVKLHLYDPQIHLIQRPVQDRVLPAAETVNAVVSAIGFTVGYDQRLDYRTATPCQATATATVERAPE